MVAVPGPHELLLGICHFSGKENEVLRLQELFVPRCGDVFFITNEFYRPILRALTELADETVQQDPHLSLPDKFSFLKAASMMHGAAPFVQKINAWTWRRCFAHGSGLHDFPCHLPFCNTGDGLPPKVLVLIADPRYIVMMLYRWAVNNFRLRVSAADFVNSFVRRELPEVLPPFRFFDDSLVWAEMAQKYPSQVREFRSDLLGSPLPKEVQKEMESIAAFLEVPQSRALETVQQLFAGDFADEKFPKKLRKRPRADEYLEPLDNFNYIGRFEEIMASLGMDAIVAWQDRLACWRDSGFPFLAELGGKASQGAASLPPQHKSVPLKGAYIHAAGECKPCSFFMRGSCHRSEELCIFCHSDGHVRVNRPSRKQRAAKQRGGFACGGGGGSGGSRGLQ